MGVLQTGLVAGQFLIQEEEEKKKKKEEEKRPQGLSFRGYKSNPGNPGPSNPEVKVRYKFNETFKDILLGIWFEKSPENYNQAREACDQFGNEMIIWLSETNIDLYRNIYQQALKETQEEIIDSRLDNE